MSPPRDFPVEPPADGAARDRAAQRSAGGPRFLWPAALPDRGLEAPAFGLLAVLLLILGAASLAGLAARRPTAPLAAPEFRVDPNRDPWHRLVALPGVGPQRAAAIVADRAARGPFRDARDLTRVPGIGPALVRKLAPHLPENTPAAEEPPDEERPGIQSAPGRGR
ncbi:MAG: helix-hairpin-helix domain-containing protein [Planctomycetes bacterium]|nr:helix-hairpin-helix domain-containing protein [Planctomycetota bacterium]